MRQDQTHPARHALLSLAVLLGLVLMPVAAARAHGGLGVAPVNVAVANAVSDGAQVRVVLALDMADGSPPMVAGVHTVEPADLRFAVLRRDTDGHPDRIAVDLAFEGPAPTIFTLHLDFGALGIGRVLVLPYPVAAGGGI